MTDYVPRNELDRPARLRRYEWSVGLLTQMSTVGYEWGKAGYEVRTLDGIPEGATIVKAYLYATDWQDNGSAEVVGVICEHPSFEEVGPGARIPWGSVTVTTNSRDYLERQAQARRELEREEIRRQMERDAERALLSNETIREKYGIEKPTTIERQFATALEEREQELRVREGASPLEEALREYAMKRVLLRHKDEIEPELEAIQREVWPKEEAARREEQGDDDAPSGYDLFWGIGIDD